MAEILLCGNNINAEDLRKAFADMTVAASKNMQAAKEIANAESETEDLKFSHRDFSYNAFVNKPDVKLTEISPVPFDKKTIINMAKKMPPALVK